MVEDEQIDELKKSTLASYAKKATDDVSYHSFMAGGMSAKNPERLAQDKKAIKRQTGVIKAIDRLTKEEVEQVDELNRGGILSRYINKTRNNPDRKAGNVLAHKKKWGDKNYGLEEPKVKGMDRNEEVKQMDEEGEISHIVAKNRLQDHKDAMESEGYDTVTKSLPKDHPKAKTHIGIVAKGVERDYHSTMGHAEPMHEEVEQMDEVDYKKYLNVSQEKRPLKLSAVDAALSAEKEGNPNPARKLRNSRDARKFANAQLAKKAAKARPAQKYDVYVPGRTYVGDSVELDGPMIDEARRMSAAIKLQRAFEREKTASDASRKRGEEILAQARAEYAKKQVAKTNEENNGTEADEGEYGYEGDMAMSQLKSIIRNAKSLHDLLEPQTDLPEWVQSKITLASDYIQTAADYWRSEKEEGMSESMGDPAKEKAERLLGGPVKKKSSVIGGKGQPTNLRNLTSRLATKAMKAGKAMSEEKLNMYRNMANKK